MRAFHGHWEGSLILDGLDNTFWVDIDADNQLLTVSFPLRRQMFINVNEITSSQKDGIVKFFLFDNPELGTFHLRKKDDNEISCVFTQIYFNKQSILLKKKYDSPKKGASSYGPEPSKESLSLLLNQYRNFELNKQDSVKVINYPKYDNGVLAMIRHYYKSEIIAGQGNDLDRAIRLTRWVNRYVRQKACVVALPPERNGLTLLNECTEKSAAMNCRGYAIILNDLLLSVGIIARFVICKPADIYDPECHVINEIYLSNMNKWVIMDGAFGCFICDENKNFLGLFDVRENLINDMPMQLWANKDTKRTQYIDAYWYGMMKNCFRFLYYWDYAPGCDNPLNRKTQYSLQPVGYDADNKHQYYTNCEIIHTTNKASFICAPF